MTPYRHETLPENQPVRFYKIVAITFLVLTIVLLGIIIFSSSKKAIITITTKTDPVEVNFVATVGANGENKIGGQVVTSTEELTKDFFPSATMEVAASKEGKMILHNDSATEQTLIPTTRLLTAEGAIFRIKNRVTVPAQGQIEVEVYFDDKNTVSSTGVGRLTVPGLNTDRQKEIYATNDKPVAGTRKVGVVSDSDLKVAEKSFVEDIISQSASKLVGSDETMKVVSKLISYTVTSSAKVGDKVDSYYLKGRAQVLSVFYKLEDVETIAKKELAKKVVGDAEVLQVNENAPTVQLAEDQTQSEGIKLNVYYNGTVTLNSDSKQLARESFFGKSEQEVRRYLLSLDHVKNVTVSFSPIWCSTVPNIADHVSVVVKSVE